MKHRLLFFLKYYLFWVLFFVLLKIVFLLYYLPKTCTLSPFEVLGIFVHGIRLDISTATYVTASSLLFIMLLAFFPNNVLKKTMRIITVFALIVCAIIAIGDLELYKYWGYRLDTTPLMYIDTPGEMMASVEWYVVVRQLIIGIALVWLSIKTYKKFVEPEIAEIKKIKFWYYPVLLILLASLIVPIRGGFKLAPLNTGSAYFCQKQFANHAANNVVWNLAFAFTYYGESTNNPFIWTDKGMAEATRDSLLVPAGKTKFILKTKRPNIVLIILESFNNKMISSLGGMADVTPNLNRYCHEGISFANIYGNGDRSDKGLVAIHSGFPSQTIASIIKFPAKTETLPFFTKDLKSAGYRCDYYYGGDINFAAMRSYIQNAHYDGIVSDESFPTSTYGAKWGVHDQFVFERLFNDIETKREEPFLKTIFTLSSHEPFDVPYHSKFNGSTEEEKFLNAGRYTDSCVGVFIEKLKKTSLWDSTLVIITADHGVGHPYNSEYFECPRFKIPMIWIGGAVNVKDSFVNRIGAQADIGITLLSQLSIVPEKPFQYGKNLLDDSNLSFAYYSFNNGFGFINDSCKIVYNNSSKTVMFSEGAGAAKGLATGKSIQQVVYSEFLKR